MAEDNEGRYGDGVALGMWVSEIGPVIRRWARSADQRVSLMAAVLGDVIGAALDRGDWACLAALHDTWHAVEVHQAAAKQEGGGE